jgi:hypothetical protein
VIFEKLKPLPYAAVIALLVPVAGILIAMVIVILPFSPIFAYFERKEELSRLTGEPGKN